MKWSDLRSPEFKGKLKDFVVLVPLGATEQHGDHLPVKTDAALAEELSNRIDKTCNDFILTLPPLWVGASHHHLDFPGTVSLRVSTYAAVLHDITESLLRQGFRKIVFLNCHGGNVPPINYFMSELQEKGGESDFWVTAVTYWTMDMHGAAKPCGMKTERLTHACEYETSMILAIDPEHVDMKVACNRKPDFQSKYFALQAEFASQVHASVNFRQITTNGAMGSPEFADAEKGKKLLSFFENKVSEFLKEFKSWPILSSKN